MGSVTQSQQESLYVDNIFLSLQIYFNVMCNSLLSKGVSKFENTESTLILFIHFFYLIKGLTLINFPQKIDDTSNEANWNESDRELVLVVIDFMYILKIEVAYVVRQLNSLNETRNPPEA